jgi:hypothetical protein
VAPTFTATTLPPDSTVAVAAALVPAPVMLTETSPGV